MTLHLGAKRTWPQLGVPRAPVWGTARPEGTGWHLGATKPQEGLGGDQGAWGQPWAQPGTLGAGEGMSLSTPAGWETSS